MLCILALDLATKVGWAIDDESGNRPRTGTYELWAGGSDLGIAGKSFTLWLQECITTWKPHAIAFEAPVMGGAGMVMNVETARLLIGLAFQAETIAAMRDLPCYEATVQQVRRHCLGNGRPENPKRAIVDWCRKLGWQVKDDNAADAAGLWCYAKSLKDKSFQIATGTPLFARAG